MYNIQLIYFAAYLVLTLDIHYAYIQNLTNHMNHLKHEKYEYSYVALVYKSMLGMEFIPFLHFLHCREQGVGYTNDNLAYRRNDLQPRSTACPMSESGLGRSRRI